MSRTTNSAPLFDIGDYVYVPSETLTPEGKHYNAVVNGRRLEGDTWCYSVKVEYQYFCGCHITYGVRAWIPEFLVEHCVNPPID
ncbi:hypothetical protein F4X90_20365 [Candidatus Poribacteria bacterium]|nr:hypothetical protein [Candidatus Poribacteria bacterium]